MTSLPPVSGQAAGRRKRRVQRLEAGGQRVDERHVVAPGGRHQGELDLHPRAGADPPAAVRIAPDVVRPVGARVAALDREAAIEGRERQVLRCVAQADPVVQAPRPLLCEHEIARATRRHQQRHRDLHVLALGAAAVERVRARVALAEPGARHEVGCRGLVGREVLVEREQHEYVLLRARPAARAAVREQAGDELRNEIALRLVGDERLEQDRVGAAVRVEQQVGAVAIGHREVRRPGRLAHAVRDPPADLARARPARPCPSRAAAAASRAPRTTASPRSPRARARARAPDPRRPAARAPRARRPRACASRPGRSRLGCFAPARAGSRARSRGSCRGPRSPWPSRARARAPRGSRRTATNGRRAARSRSRRRRSAARAAARRRARRPRAARQAPAVPRPGTRPARP